MCSKLYACAKISSPGRRLSYLNIKKLEPSLMIKVVLSSAPVSEPVHLRNTDLTANTLIQDLDPPHLLQISEIILTILSDLNNF